MTEQIVSFTPDELRLLQRLIDAERKRVIYEKGQPDTVVPKASEVYIAHLPCGDFLPAPITADEPTSRVCCIYRIEETDDGPKIVPVMETGTIILRQLVYNTHLGFAFGSGFFHVSKHKHGEWLAIRAGVSAVSTTTTTAEPGILCDYQCKWEWTGTEWNLLDSGCPTTTSTTSTTSTTTSTTTTTPTPTGACCFYSIGGGTRCEDDYTQADCEFYEGAWYGAGSECAGISCATSTTTTTSTSTTTSSTTTSTSTTTECPCPRTDATTTTPDPVCAYCSYPPFCGSDVGMTTGDCYYSRCTITEPTQVACTTCDCNTTTTLNPADCGGATCEHVCYTLIPANPYTGAPALYCWASLDSCTPGDSGCKCPKPNGILINDGHGGQINCEICTSCGDTKTLDCIPTTTTVAPGCSDDQSCAWANNFSNQCTAAGVCHWYWTGLAWALDYAKAQALYGQNGFCLTSIPAPPCEAGGGTVGLNCSCEDPPYIADPVCGQTVTSACKYNACQPSTTPYPECYYCYNPTSSTTPGPNSCDGLCKYKWNGTVWDGPLVDPCGDNCPCALPPGNYAGSDTCEVYFTACMPTTTTTTTTSTTTTSTSTTDTTTTSTSSTTTTTTTTPAYYCVANSDDQADCATVGYCSNAHTPADEGTAGLTICNGPYATLVACEADCPSAPTTTTTTTTTPIPYYCVTDLGGDCNNPADTFCLQTDNTGTVNECAGPFANIVLCYGNAQCSTTTTTSTSTGMPPPSGYCCQGGSTCVPGDPGDCPGEWYSNGGDCSINCSGA